MIMMTMAIRSTVVRPYGYFIHSFPVVRSKTIQRSSQYTIDLTTFRNISSFLHFEFFSINQ